MARVGITYQQVADAVQQLLAAGQQPTIERIRLLTGTGSSTTIAQHWRTLKKKQDDTRLLCMRDQLPSEFISLMQGLWERVLDQAEAQVDSIKQNFDRSLEEWSRKLQVSQENLMHCEQNNNQLQEVNASLNAENQSLTKMIRALENDLLSFRVSVEKTTQHLQEKQDRIHELTRLNQQVQANLEHYRDASREQRLSEQQRHIQIQTQLEQHNQQIREEITTLNKIMVAKQHDYEQLDLSYQLLKTQHEEQSRQFQQLEQDLAQHLQLCQRWQSDCQSLQEKNQEQNVIILELQKQTAALSHQLQSANSQLTTVNQNYLTVANEKWLLGQEKAQLQGQLMLLKQLKQTT